MNGHTRPLAQTTRGPVRGLRSDADVEVFLGIPYAADPSGANRFRPPRPRAAWTVPFEATGGGLAFCQPPADPDYLACFAADPPASVQEDALVVNVWTPRTDAARRPVMVYIHGGGYFSGSGTELPAYDGSALARAQDVVVVTFNYRLGAFGFLYLAGVAGQEYADSGNAGLHDMVAALRWVRDNITAFGGDPGNVTIFGSSAGGHAVTTLTAVPGAKGLFHRAIAQSGHALFCRSPEAATTVTESYLEALGLSTSDIGRLHGMPADELLDGQVRMAAQLGGIAPTLLGGPVADGRLLPGAPLEVARPLEVPLMIGSNGHEEECGGGVEQFVNTWLTGAAAPVYVYRFAWQPDLPPGRPMPEHGLELPFVFGNVDCPLTGSGPGREALARRLGAVWASFARAGDPNHPELVPWPPYRRGAPAVMALGEDYRLE